MKAVRLHAYHDQPVVEEVAEPTISGAFDVIVRVGGAGVCRTDLHIIEGPTSWATRTPGGCTRSVRRSPTWPLGIP